MEESLNLLTPVRSRVHPQFSYSPSSLDELQYDNVQATAQPTAPEEDEEEETDFADQSTEYLSQPHTDSTSSSNSFMSRIGKQKKRPFLLDQPNTWSGDDMILMLQGIRTHHENKVSELCIGKEIFLFYANPIGHAQGRLNVEKEILMTLDLVQYSDRVFVVPVTTRSAFNHYMKHKNPKIVCFIGHCDDEHIAFCNSENRLDKVDHSQFVNMLHHANKTVKFVGIFACKSERLAAAIKVKFKESKTQLSILYWKTMTEDGCSRALALKMLSKIMMSLEPDGTTKYETLNYKSFYDASVEELKRQGFTLKDPEKLEYLDEKTKTTKTWNAQELHIHCFRRNLERHFYDFDDSQSTKSLSQKIHDLKTIFNLRNERLILGGLVEGCPHCTNTHRGIPEFTTTSDTT